MAQTGYTPIILYHSTTAAAAPTSGNLNNGELALNIQDEKLYFKNAGGTVKLLASSAGAAGDVVGPASATDNAIVRFDGTTGKLVQNSVVTIADSTGDISGVGQLNATTLDATNIEVTNIKAKDGTASATIADSTGVMTIGSSVLTTADINGGTIDGTAIGGTTPAAGAFTTLSATGNATLSNSTAEIQFTGATYGWLRATVGDLYVDAPTAKSIFLRNAGSTIANISSTGLSVTGTLSATGAIRGTFFDSAVIYGGADNDNFTAVYGTSHPSLPNQWEVTLDGANRARITTTGLSVTGTISSTGALSVGAGSGIASFVDVKRDTAGSTTDLGVSNLDNTNGASNAQVRIYTGGASGGDPILNFEVFNQTRYYMGIDNSNSDALVIGNGYSPGSNDCLTITSAGNVGIGTASPATRLDIRGGGGTANTIRIGSDTNDTGTIEFFNTVSSTVNSTITANLEGGNAGGDIRFSTKSVAGLLTERMRINSSGNVGIGTTSPDALLTVNTIASFGDGAVTTPSIAHKGDLNTGFWFPAADTIAASTGGSERIRIDSSGNLLVGTTDSASTTGVGLKQIYNATVPYIITVVNDSIGSNYYLLYNTNATNNGYRFYVQANGGVANYSGNNTNLSDERTKENIELASSYLNKICAIPVKTFNYKDEPVGEQKTLGVIAQDVEAVAPEFVNNDGFGETKEGEIPFKSVYTTDLMFALMKSIQELKAELDTAKARIAALEAK